jgi:hypothetical protein
MRSDDRAKAMSQGWQRPGYETVMVVRHDGEEALGVGWGGLVWRQRVKDLGLGSMIGMAGAGARLTVS